MMWLETDPDIFDSNDDLRQQLVDFNISVVKTYLPAVASQIEAMIFGNVVSYDQKKKTR